MILLLCLLDNGHGTEPDIGGLTWLKFFSKKISYIEELHQIKSWGKGNTYVISKAIKSAVLFSE